MERLMFGWDFEVDAWSRFWRWNLIKICVWIRDMTSRCYFGKMNSILGSVVPLAMFGKEIFAYFRVLAAMIPSFGAKKAAPAFQVKKALTTGNNSSIASIKNLSDGSTPGNPTTATSIETTAPLTTSSTSGANLPQQVHLLRQAGAGVCKKLSIWRFATNITSISPQLAARSPIAKFDKTQLIWDTLY